MNSLFDNEPYSEIKTRLDKLHPENNALWGKMDVAQMLSHCQKPLQVPLERITLKKPNPVLKFIFSYFKKTLYDDKPWKKNLPTSKEFRVVEEKDFKREKEELLSLINEFHLKKEQQKWPPHPFCGHFTAKQWGKMQYKHLDHHFRQFGA